MKLSLFDTPAARPRIKNDKVTLFPEGILGYLLGPTMALLANSVIANYFNAYMSNVLDINKWAAAFFTWLPVFSVIFVVLGNILVGRLMDHIRTKAGKAHPLIILSLPFSILSLVILFILSPYVNDSMPEKQTMALVLIAVGYMLWFGFAAPMYGTPHAALVSLSTRDSKDRSLLATISNATGLAAMGAFSMILPFFLRHLFVYDMSGHGTPVMSDAGEILYYTDAAGAAIYDGLDSYNHWKLFVIILMVITAVGVIVEYFFTRERVTEENMALEENAVAETPSLTVKEQMNICFKDRFWVLLMLMFFLYQLGGMMKNVSQLYFCQAMFRDAQGNYTVANGGTLQGLLAIIGGIPTALGMFIALPLSNRIGKARAIQAGAVLAAVGGVPGLIFSDNLTIVIASFIVKALGSTPAMYLSLALIADVLDHQEALHGQRTDGFTMTVYGAIFSGMTGLATGLMNAVLSLMNYSSSNISSPAIRAAMPWIFFGGEVIGFACIAVLFLFMKVERYGAFDHASIRMDHAKAAGETYEAEVFPESASLREFNALRAENGRDTLPSAAR